MIAMLWTLLALLCAGLALCLYLAWRRNLLTWLPAYCRQDWRAPVPAGTTRHVLFCFVDHYEPQWRSPDYATECARVDRWHKEYPALCSGHRDADGRPPVHTFFYPEEEY